LSDGIKEGGNGVGEGEIETALLSEEGDGSRYASQHTRIAPSISWLVFDRRVVTRRGSLDKECKYTPLHSNSYQHHRLTVRLLVPFVHLVVRIPQGTEHSGSEIDLMDEGKKHAHHGNEGERGEGK